MTIQNPGQRWCWIAVLAVSAATLLACSARPAAMPTGGGARIPVTRVVLYQNGVGYFERAATVSGNLLSLQIRPSQINDILKSLTVIERGSGRPVSVSLPLEQTADRLLNELPEQVRDAGGLLAVLQVFRGAHVDIVGSRGSIAGRVIGVENLETSSGDEVAADWRVSIKSDDDEIIAYPIREIRRVTLHDETLSIGLERSLDVSLGEGGWKPIELTIRLAGEGPHQLLVSYIVEMPRWKPAYRLVLGKKEKPLLQGWAVVDNVSGEAWNDVSLSLVSGAPISFQYNLHAPQYAERVDLTPVGLPRATPPPPGEPAGFEEESRAAATGSREVTTFDFDDAADEESLEAEPVEKPKAKKSKPRPKPAPAPATQRAPVAPPPDMRGLLQDQGGEAQAASVGALFRYDIKDPVTIPDRSSTLVNIVNQTIVGEEVVYFRPELTASQAESHPYRAVRFQNRTGFSLEKGPITVYSNGTFVGEGFVERMERGTTSFLTFAVDANVLLDQKGGTREEGLHLLRIVDGVIISEAQRIQATTYEVNNRHDTPVRAYIRTAKRSGWKLKQRPKGTVDTPEALIVPVTVPAKKKASVSVEWAQRITRRLAVDSHNTDELLRLYLAGGKAPPAVAQAMKELLEVKATINEKKKEEERVEKQHATTSRDQDRVRANLKVLRKSPGNQQLKADLARKLAKLEEELGKLSGRLVALSEEIAELEARMRVLIRGISLPEG